MRSRQPVLYETVQGWQSGASARWPDQGWYGPRLRYRGPILNKNPLNHFSELEKVRQAHRIKIVIKVAIIISFKPNK